MPYNPEKHHRRSIRARGYDYSSPGYYFVNACTQHRECFYGEVVGTEMQLNDAGRMVEHWWQRLAGKFVQVDLDEHITMPNHFHGIIAIVDRYTRAPMYAPSCDGSDAASIPGKRVPLGEIVQWFKTMTTNEFIRGVKESGWPRFDRKLWQRDYFEHVIRDEKSLNNIRRYIWANPLMWPFDRDNPESVQPDGTRRLHLASQLGVTEQMLESIVSFDDEYRNRSEGQGHTDVSAFVGELHGTKDVGNPNQGAHTGAPLRTRGPYVSPCGLVQPTKTERPS